MSAFGDRLGRGLAFPPHVGADGSMAWSEGEENIRQSIRVALLTGRGERPRLPEYGGGLTTVLRQPNTTPTQHDVAERIRRCVEEWEPRVRVVDVEVTPDPVDPSGAVAVVTYSLVSTGDVRALTLNTAPSGTGTGG